MYSRANRNDIALLGGGCDDEVEVSDFAMDDSVKWNSDPG
jgi:hypothetical protein